jgi:subtilisin family serine protease
MFYRVFLLLTLALATAHALRMSHFGGGPTTKRQAADGTEDWVVRIVCPLSTATVLRVENAFLAIASTEAALAVTQGAPACRLNYAAQGTLSTILRFTCRTLPAPYANLSATRIGAALATQLVPMCVAAGRLIIERDGIVTVPPLANVSVGARASSTPSSNKWKRPPRALAATESTTQTITLPGLWNIDRLDQRQLPLDGQYTYALDGSCVTIISIDTGARLSHEEFSGRATLLLDTINDGTPDGGDANGHGTHTLGTAGGITYGVAKNAILQVMRVLDASGSGSFSDVATALTMVEDLQSCSGCAHAAVVSMSLAGGTSSTINSLVDGLVTSFHTVVVSAAGNNGGDACALSPASATTSLTVAATDDTDAMPSWSNRGSCVDVAAPGDSILSAWNTGDTATNTLSGTSMATPLTAGVVALELQRLLLAAPGTVPDPATARANVIAMATQAQINAGSGQLLPLVFSSEGLAPQPQPPPPPPPPPPTSSGGSVPPFGRSSSSSAAEVPLQPLVSYAGVAILVGLIVF